MLIPNKEELNCPGKLGNLYIEKNYNEFYNHLLNFYKDYNYSKFSELLYCYYNNITTHPTCPVCGKEVVYRKTKKGRRYYGCEDNPECEFMSWQKPVAEKCPKCGKYMIEKGNSHCCSDEQCGFVEKKQK